MDRRIERILFIAILCSLLLLFTRWRQNVNAHTEEPEVSTFQPLLETRRGLLTQGDYYKEPVTLRNLDPANSTLGFGTIAAVSKADSRRLPGLILAGNITEIDINIPAQPAWTEGDLLKLYADVDSRLNRGSALAWLGHLNTLRWFLNTDLETILIFEDDVDWDIHLRSVQVPAAAAAVRRVTANLTDPPAPVDYVPEIDNYWGNTSSWDLLYLGHCGDIFKPSSWSQEVARVVYQDETLPNAAHLHPYTAKFLSTIGVPSGMRMIHKSVFPLCTFGFALTRHGAYRLLHEFANKEPNGGKMAYDVRVLEACRDFGLRCWSVNPELFHHIDSESMIAVVNKATGTGAADDSGRLKPVRGGQTPNIACPIRSKYFFTEDPETLEFLREEVGRRGQCLRDVMEEDQKRVPDLDPDLFNAAREKQDPRLDNSGT